MQKSLKIFILNIVKQKNLIIKLLIVVNNVKRKSVSKR